MVNLFHWSTRGEKVDIKTAYAEAVKEDIIDLQALILFLVMEKKTLSMTDHINELDLYFKENNRNRMNQELNKFKKKMKLHYKPKVYKVCTDDRTLYVYANDIHECNYRAARHSNEVKSINVYTALKVVLNGRIRTIKDITTGIKTPALIGSNTLEKNYKRGLN